MKEKWYKDGIHFSCVGCGDCCGGGTPGDIWVTPKDVKKMAKHLAITEYEFKKTYTRVDGRKRSIIEQSKEFDHNCIFLKDSRCQIYPVRPIQCKTFPFWNPDIKSERSYNQLIKNCKGAGQGKLHKQQQIEHTLNEFQV